MLEDTAHTTEKIPNTLALVASQMALEKAKEFQEEARKAAEQARRADQARARYPVFKESQNQDKVYLSTNASAQGPAASQPAPSKIETPPSDPRGGSVDLKV